MEPRTSMRPALMITAAGADARAQFGRPAAGVSADEVIDAVQSNEADDDQVDGHNVVQQSRHEQNQNAGDEGNERRDMGNGDGHGDLLGSQLMIMMVSAPGSTWCGPLPILVGVIIRESG